MLGEAAGRCMITLVTYEVQSVWGMYVLCVTCYVLCEKCVHSCAAHLLSLSLFLCLSLPLLPVLEIQSSVCVCVSSVVEIGLWNIQNHIFLISLGTSLTIFIAIFLLPCLLLLSSETRDQRPVTSDQWFISIVPLPASASISMYSPPLTISSGIWIRSNIWTHPNAHGHNMPPCQVKEHLNLLKMLYLVQEIQA